MKLPAEAWCNLYDDKLPSTWHRTRELADRMSAKNRAGVIHLRREPDGRYAAELEVTA